MKTRHCVLFVLALAAGCAGKYDYVRPTSDGRADNVKIVDRPRDAVWSATVPALGAQYFVINSLDKSSGLINLSFSGDPEANVDCGRITTYVKNLRGERTYEFPGARAAQVYEYMAPDGGALYSINRRMGLEGRVNLILEELGPNQTRATVTVRYVVSKNIDSVNTEGRRNHLQEAISFNTGASAAFPTGKTECVGLGKIERDVLGLVQ